MRNNDNWHRLIARQSERYLFALNYEAHPITLTLKKPMVSLLSGQEGAGKITLPAYDVQVWTV